MPHMLSLEYVQKKFVESALMFRKICLQVVDREPSPKRYIEGDTRHRLFDHAMGSPIMGDAQRCSFFTEHSNSSQHPC